MKKTIGNQELKERLDRLTHEIVQLKSILIAEAQPDKSKSEDIWNELMKDSENISTLWSGCSAIEEIQSQREK